MRIRIGAARSMAEFSMVWSVAVRTVPVLGKYPMSSSAQLATLRAAVATTQIFTKSDTTGLERNASPSGGKCLPPNTIVFLCSFCDVAGRATSGRRAWAHGHLVGIDLLTPTR